MKRLFLFPALAMCVFGCSKQQDVIPATDPPPSIMLKAVTLYDTIGVSVDQNTAWMQIPSNFTGMSYEVAQIPQNNFLVPSNTVLIQLLKNLGGGVIRLGGYTSEKVFWTNNVRKTKTGTDSLTTTDIDTFSAFSKALGWPVIFGLNLGKSTPTVAISESKYLNTSLGTQLQALQIGNEPDLYTLGYVRGSTYSVNDFISEWESYYTAIHGALPQVKFAGPDVGYNTQWISSFLASESSRIAFTDGHYYAGGPGSDSTITTSTLLNSTPVTEDWYFQKLKSAAGTMPYRLTECNSIYSGGRKGVSDVFASALWGLNYMWQAVVFGSQGVYFHGGDNWIYSPIAGANGATGPRPLYYALLAFKYGTQNNGHVTPTTVSGNKNRRQIYVYSTMDATSTYTTLINKDSVNLVCTVQLVKAASTMKLSRLTAPSLTSTDVTFSGKTTNADGTFTYTPEEQQTVAGKSVTITLPAYSAAIATFQ